MLPLPSDPLRQLLLVSLIIHVPFAVAWVGVALFGIVVTAAPGLAPEQRGRLLLRTAPLVLAAIPVLLLTGVFQTIYNPLTEPAVTWELLEKLRATPYGTALFYKHGFVLMTVAATWLLVFGFGNWLAQSRVRAANPIEAGAPAGAGASVAATTPVPARDAADRMSRRAVQVSILNGLLCLGLLLCVTYIVFSLR